MKEETELAGDHSLYLVDSRLGLAKLGVAPDPVLLALPKIGSVKAGRILADCGIAHSKRWAASPIASAQNC